MKSVTDTFLEQRAILAVGWLRRSGRIAAQKKCAKEELPQGFAHSSREYARAQGVLARDAVDKLMRQVIGMNDRAAEHIKICQQQRAAIAASAGAGKKAAKKANDEARALAKKIETAQGTLDLSERLLRILRGQEKIPLPTLALYKYAPTLEKLEGKAVPPKTIHSKSKPAAIPLYKKIVQGFHRKTDRSDRIALLIAFLVCTAIAVSGLYYTFYSGDISLEVTPVDTACLQVLCVNSTHDSILLNLPYSGGDLALESATHFGLLLEFLDKKGNVTRPRLPETLWKYKDTPAHLYGPIVVGPMFAAELQLDLKECARDAGIAALRLTLFRAPRQKYQTFDITLPEGFWDNDL